MTAVVDGDTIRVETLGGRQLGRVRLLGIDAPEVDHPPEPAECYAKEATGLLERLAPVGSTVELVTDIAQPNRDRYDRLLRYVEHDDADVARELLASGAAAATKPTRCSRARRRTPRPPTMPRALSAACGATAESQGGRSWTSS